MRAVTPFHPAYKLEEGLLEAAERDASGSVRVDLLTTRRAGHAPVVEWLEARGGRVDAISVETHLMTATLDARLLPALAALNEVQWIDRWGAPGTDVNIARQFHGAVFLEELLGLRGRGVHVEVLDQGVDTSHPAISNFIVHNGNSPSGHGTGVSGIVVGNGAGNPAVHGVMPEALLVIGDFDEPWAGGSRYAHTGELIDPTLPYQCVLQTNSWGGPRTTQYNSRSHDMDLMLFDFATTQHHAVVWGTPGFAEGRPAGLGQEHPRRRRHQPPEHRSRRADDFWSRGVSTGPAADGRVKPDIASFYDSIIDDQHPEGATPALVRRRERRNRDLRGPPRAVLLAHVAPRGLRKPDARGKTIFENAPNNSTAKAVVINTAGQWPYSAARTTTSNRLQAGLGRTSTCEP